MKMIEKKLNELWNTFFLIFLNIKKNWNDTDFEFSWIKILTWMIKKFVLKMIKNEKWMINKKNSINDICKTLKNLSSRDW